MTVSVKVGSKEVTIYAESLSAMVEYASGKVGNGVKEHERSSRRDYGVGFNEYRSWGAAMERVFHDPERVAGITRAHARIATGQRTRTELMRSPNRGALNMGAYLADDPRPRIDARRRSETVAGRGKAVTIMVNGAASSGIDADALARKGAAVLTLVDALERAGRPVEVIVGSYSTAGSRTIDVRVTLKRAGQRMSLDALAFAIGSPDFFRRVIFGARERALKVRAFPASPSTWRNVPAGAVVIDSVSLDRDGATFSTDEGVSQWVERQLNACGVAIS